MQFRMNFQVELDSFRGPLDLLLFLVRKHEVEITEIPISRLPSSICNTWKCSTK